MQRGVTRHDAAGERPSFSRICKTGANRISRYIRASGGEGAAVTLLFAQHMIVRLVLPAGGSEMWFQLRAEKRGRAALIGRRQRPHPDQVKVIGHEGINWTKESLARCRVQQEFTADGMKRGREPAGAAMSDRMRPKHDGAALVPLGFETGEMDARSR